MSSMIRFRWTKDQV